MPPAIPTPVLQPEAAPPPVVPTLPVDPVNIPVPTDEADLLAQEFPSTAFTTLVDEHEESALLSCTALPADPAYPDLCTFETLNVASGETSALLAEDGLPWVEDPLTPTEGYAFCVEIPLKEKDFRKWQKEEFPENMSYVASVGRKTRAEVKLKELTPAEAALFKEAKDKELTSWVQTNAIRRILRSRLNPEQILKSRWVLTWKHPDPNDQSVKKAKARLVVLGYMDPRLTEVARDSPTLSREGRAIVLQTIASMRWKPFVRH